MRKFSFMLASVMMLGAVSCNNGTENKEEVKAKDSMTTTTVTEPEKPAFSPFKAMVVNFKIKDYNSFPAVYHAKEKDSLRAAHMISPYVLGRGIDDSNQVVIIEKFMDLQQAKDFTKSPLIKASMDKLGLKGAPSFDFVDVIWQDPTVIDQKDRLRVTHHVKDYAAWKKVFDAEGKDTRASFGLVDRAISRGIEDSNMVTIVFAVTDMAKAKARGNSPELKKIMQDAGVDGKPTIVWYRITEMVK